MSTTYRVTAQNRAGLPYDMTTSDPRQAAAWIATLTARPTAYDVRLNGQSWDEIQRAAAGNDN